MIETFGKISGYFLGIFFAAGSLFRHSRILHPRGLLFSGELENLPGSPVNFPAHVMIRFSSAWWKYQEWPDALGVAIRMSEKKISTPAPSPRDRDLLFATFRRPWEIFYCPLLTDHHDFQDNNYFSISPFELETGDRVEFMIDPARGHRSSGTRTEKLISNVMGGGVMLRLMMRTYGSKTWKLIARITVRDELELDQEALRFHPFMTGKGVRPSGFLQHMRYGAYRMSQYARPGEESVEGEWSPE